MSKQIKKENKWYFVAEKLGEKIFDLANIVAGTMVFGQFIVERPFNREIAFVGIGILIVLYSWSVILLVKSGR